VSWCLTREVGEELTPTRTRSLVLKGREGCGDQRRTKRVFLTRENGGGRTCEETKEKNEDKSGCLLLRSSISS
jgi:hypothetical protein